MRVPAARQRVALPTRRALTAIGLALAWPAVGLAPVQAQDAAPQPGAAERLPQALPQTLPVTVEPSRARPAGRQPATSSGSIESWNKPPIGARRPNADDSRQPVLFSASEVNYDDALGLVIATGKVEIAQGERLLIADRVTYERNTSRVTASGNVVLHEPTGEVMFADYVELGDEFKDGVIRNMGVRLLDNSRFAAAEAERSSGNRTTMRKAIFSPCDECKEDPERAPVWQMKAQRVVHDQESRDIKYYNAFLEVFGIPVFYMPYFTHPDPTVERRSGFLAPTFGSGDNSGVYFSVPYYLDLGSDLDATIAPIVLTNVGLIANGEVRKRFGFGEARIAASAGVADRKNGDGTVEERAFRGHVNAKASFHVDENWRTSVDVQRASDPTYLRRFRLGRETVLTSELRTERFDENSHFQARALAFQGLRAGDRRRETPTILPQVTYDYMSNPDRFGGRATLNAGALSLVREQGSSMYRLSSEAAYAKPWMIGNGQILTATASLRGDLYYVSDAPQPNSAFPKNTVDGWESRVLPQLTLDWRYPFARSSGTSQQFIEPVAHFAIAPNVGSGNIIQNEDSSDFELSDTNIFRRNRFAGIDRMEGGIRAGYGINAGYYGDLGQAKGFVGQTYRLRSDSTFEKGSGLDQNASDFVGRLDLAPVSWLTGSYRFRIDSDRYRIARDELVGTIGGPRLRLQTSYVFVKDTERNPLTKDREEIVASLSSKFTKNWSGSLGYARDITNEQDLNYIAGLTYQDECIRIDTRLNRHYFEDREIRPETSVFLRVTFKYLGSVQGGF